MRIDPNGEVEAFTRLADKSGEVQSMQPHLGKHVNVPL